MERSVVVRAWGFSEEEYVAAYCFIVPKERAVQGVREMFGDLERNPQHTIGGSNTLFALLSLTSESAKQRAKLLTNWTDVELAAQQQEVLAKRDIAEI